MLTRIVYGNGTEKVIPHDDAIVIKNGEDNDEVFVSFEDSDKHMHYKLSKKDDELYLMNDQGQTVDSYRWQT